MGYSIPPGDYSRPPMQINVAAELGRSLGAGLASMRNRKEKEKADAKREKATQNAFKNNLLINATKAQDTFIANLNKEGYIDDPEDDGQLIDQWKMEIKNKGIAAIEARMKMEFDQDLSDEDRMGFAQTVSDFETYSSGSLEQLGNFVTDATDSTSEGFVVTGNSKNGEQTVNMMTLANIQGNSSMFGPGAVSTRNLQVRNNQNFVTSTVKIPVDSEYLKGVNTQGGGLAFDQLDQWSQPGGTIKKETIGDKDYYVFESEINLSSYGGPGGVDLVSEAIKVPGSDSVFEKAGLMEKGSFNARYNDETTITTQEVEKDSITGKPTGYLKNVSYNIVDVGAMAQSPAYLADINAQYESVFLDPKTNPALKNEYLLDLAKNQPGVKALDWNDLSDMDPDKAKELVTNAMVMHQWTGYFPKQFGEKTSLAQVKLEKGSALLKQAGKFKNPTSPDNYKVGDMVYVTRHVKERYDDPKPKENKANSDFQVRMGKLNTKINDAANNDTILDLFNTVQQTPGQETYLKRIGKKVVEVKQLTTSGEWVMVEGSVEYGVADLKSIYEGY